MKSLNIFAIAISLAALGTAFLVPVYVQSERNAALENSIKLEALNQLKRSRQPEIACVDGVAWVTVYSSSFPTSSAVWSDNPVDMDSLVKCDMNGYTLDGKGITKGQVFELSRKHFIEEEKRPGGGFPSIDLSAVYFLKENE